MTCDLTKIDMSESDIVRTTRDLYRDDDGCTICPTCAGNQWRAVKKLDARPRHLRSALQHMQWFWLDRRRTPGAAMRIDVTRTASLDEIVAEMDRRGTALDANAEYIERLKAVISDAEREITALRAGLKAWPGMRKTTDTVGYTTSRTSLVVTVTVTNIILPLTERQGYEDNI